ncbi:MAG: hypothetical protein EOO75_11360 [Myxococcales bacterium]|nr:MAG: hypothetical protein EOO75_11360 [Myxococcales bacterium]
MLHPDEGWQAVLAIERAEDERCGPVTPGNDSARDLHAALRRAPGDQAPPDRLDPATERLRAALLHTRPNDDDVDPTYQALVAFWVGAAGLGFALDVCTAPEPWSCQGRGLERVLVGPPDAFPTTVTRWGRLQHSGLPRELRRLLFALDEEAFRTAHAQGVDWLERRGAQVTPGFDLDWEADLVAYVLARDPSLAHQRVRAMLEHRLSGAQEQLLASLTDVALARALVARSARVLDVGGALVALDVVEGLGRDAAELMQAILDAAAGRKPALKSFYKGRFEAAKKLALTDPRPPTP